MAKTLPKSVQTIFLQTTPASGCKLGHIYIKIMYALLQRMRAVVPSKALSKYPIHSNSFQERLAVLSLGHECCEPLQVSHPALPSPPDPDASSVCSPPPRACWAAAGLPPLTWPLCLQTLRHFLLRLFKVQSHFRGTTCQKCWYFWCISFSDTS